jgi:hypothetical protein
VLVVVGSCRRLVVVLQIEEMLDFRKITSRVATIATISLKETEGWLQ